MRPRARFLRAVLVAGVVSGGNPAAAEPSAGPPAPGKFEISVLGGFGYGVKLHFGVSEEQFVVLQPQAGIGLGRHFEYLIEGQLAKYFRPSGFAAGLVPVGARYFFGTGDAAPYVALGAGFCWTDLQVPELSRRFNFILQGSLGVRGATRAGQAWTVEARFLHYSNANTVLPNLGLNGVALLVGWRLPSP
jgi:hypothetical protein